MSLGLMLVPPPVASPRRHLSLRRAAAPDLGRLLASLGAGWHVLDRVPVGDHDVDKLLIGPGGVFAIDVQEHPRARVWVGADMVRVDGTHRPYVPDSRRTSQELGERLAAVAGFDVDVQPVVALLGTRRLEVHLAPDDVLVVRPMRLIRQLRLAPPVLGPRSVELLRAAAGHLSRYPSALAIGA